MLNSRGTYGWGGAFGTYFQIDPKEQLIYIGNPDLLLLKNVDISRKETSICYLCQSLVEDGRLEKDKYINLHKKLIIIIKKKMVVFEKSTTIFL